MKRLMALMGALALVAFTITPVHATVRWVEDPLRVRIQNGSYNNSYADSTARSWAAATRADTTAAFPIINLLPNPNTVTAAGVDTALAFILYFNAEPGVTTTSDSIYVTAQVSMDGSTWTIATSLHNSQTSPISSGIASSLVLEASSSNCYALPFDYQTRSAATASDFSTATEGTAPTMNQVFGWRLIRFIIAADNETSYRTISLGHWADVAPQR